MTEYEIGVPFRLFTEEECIQWINRANKWSDSKVYGQDTSIVRTNPISWVEITDNEYSKFWELARQWHEHITWFEHPIQISRYSSKEFYHWHKDVKPTNRSSQRYLSLTSTLQSAPGAKFETENQSYDLTSGEAVFFYSDTLHRATAPTSSERISLTIWYMQKTK